MALILYSPILNSEKISALIAKKASELAGLKKLYNLLPPTRCKCKAHCCSMLPEMSLLEALVVFERMRRESDSQRQKITQKIVRYFFVNPAQISTCPFLVDKRCSIYEDRFFGCRAYGQWSPRHYEKMAHQNRLAKLSFGRQWQKLGITLPEKVVEFKQPYCLDVETHNDLAIDDKALVKISTDIHMLSDRLAPWHRTFSEMYYADFSFLVASMIYDIRKLLQMKVDIVRELVTGGRSAKLEDTLKSDWRDI